MVTVLLASTDPLQRMAAGDGADTYVGLAARVVDALRAGATLADLLALLRCDADVEPAHAFSRAALTWWSVDAPRRGLAAAA